MLHVAVLYDVACHEGVDGESIVGIEITPGDDLVGQAPSFVARPCLNGEHERALVNQAVLKREQSEEEMAVGGEGGHGRVSRKPGTVVARSVPGAGGLPPWCSGSAGLSHAGPADAAPSPPIADRISRPRGSAPPTRLLRVSEPRRRTSERGLYSVRVVARADRPIAALRASVRRHRRAQGGSSMLRSI